MTVICTSDDSLGEGQRSLLEDKTGELCPEAERQPL